MPSFLDKLRAEPVTKEQKAATVASFVALALFVCIFRRKQRSKLALESSKTMPSSFDGNFDEHRLSTAAIPRSMVAGGLDTHTDDESLSNDAYNTDATTQADSNDNDANVFIPATEPALSSSFTSTLSPASPAALTPSYSDPVSFRSPSYTTSPRSSSSYHYIPSSWSPNNRNSTTTTSGRINKENNNNYAGYFIPVTEPIHSMFGFPAMGSYDECMPSRHDFTRNRSSTGGRSNSTSNSSSNNDGRARGNSIAMTEQEQAHIDAWNAKRPKGCVGSVKLRDLAPKTDGENGDVNGQSSSAGREGELRVRWAGQ